MSDEEKDQESPAEDQESNAEEQHTPGMDDLSDEGKEQVDQMQAAYDDDRQTAVLPGTDGTITGVAINEWLDDDGNPKFGKDEQKKKDEGGEQNEPQDADAEKENAS
jgi:hypothetical protein